MNKLIILALSGMLFAPLHGFGQHQKCGAQAIKEMLIAKDPQNAARLQHRSNQLAAQTEVYEESLKGVKLKTTAVVTIPVVFHIVLNSTQITQLGGNTGIEQRVLTQLDVLNRDFSKTNSDIGSVPAPFQPLAGNTDIQFGLARQKPDGSGTDGYEIKTITSSGFSSLSNNGSDSKSSSTGGLDAWQLTPNSIDYLNIWVVNISESGVLGYTVPPSFAIGGFYQKWETGLVIDYSVFGKRTSGSQYFFPSSNDLGRTATHEAGHFFELDHTWGDDNGKCPGSGGVDDGISDTPPQADATYSPTSTTCPSFPRYDACTPSGDGIMWMNYMDYVDDKCMYMFTNGQVNRMRTQISPGGISFNLTQHPQLLWPTSIVGVEKNSTFVVSPNPSSGRFQINFMDTKGLKKISILNMIGQTVFSTSVTDPSLSKYELDLQGMGAGIYLIQCSFADGTATKKIVLQ